MTNKMDPASANRMYSHARSFHSLQHQSKYVWGADQSSSTPGSALKSAARQQRDFTNALICLSFLILVNIGLSLSAVVISLYSVSQSNAACKEVVHQVGTALHHSPPAGVVDHGRINVAAGGGGHHVDRSDASSIPGAGRPAAYTPASRGNRYEDEYYERYYETRERYNGIHVDSRGGIYITPKTPVYSSETDVDRQVDRRDADAGNRNGGSNGQAGGWNHDRSFVQQKSTLMVRGNDHEGQQEASASGSVTRETQPAAATTSSSHKGGEPDPASINPILGSPRVMYQRMGDHYSKRHALNGAPAIVNGEGAAGTGSSSAAINPPSPRAAAASTLSASSLDLEEDHHRSHSRVEGAVQHPDHMATEGSRMSRSLASSSSSSSFETQTGVADGSRRTIAEEYTSTSTSQEQSSEVSQGGTTTRISRSSSSSTSSHSSHVFEHSTTLPAEAASVNPLLLSSTNHILVDPETSDELTIDSLGRGFDRAGPRLRRQILTQRKRGSMAQLSCASGRTVSGKRSRREDLVPDAFEDAMRLVRKADRSDQHGAGAATPQQRIALESIITSTTSSAASRAGASSVNRTARFPHGMKNVVLNVNELLHHQQQFDAMSNGDGPHNGINVTNSVWLVAPVKVGEAWFEWSDGDTSLKANPEHSPYGPTFRGTLMEIFSPSAWPGVDSGLHQFLREKQGTSSGSLGSASGSAQAQAQHASSPERTTVKFVERFGAEVVTRAEVGGFIVLRINNVDSSSDQHSHEEIWDSIVVKQERIPEKLATFSLTLLGGEKPSHLSWNQAKASTRSVLREIEAGLVDWLHALLTKTENLLATRLHVEPITDLLRHCKSKRCVELSTSLSDYLRNLSLAEHLGHESGEGDADAFHDRDSRAEREL
eukprot:CAMPEP_0178991188 /NCGR_PEP_ID=MMETSP0795-20121207/5380_1 /TAXON_ID=88552 /ORGANISM="Amoebophrya sp., Strain Ameob2" /LENGTH=883 /DNA_ID=CAMNT_0020682851 /DNA_START=566 /DNA_END=3217 /DNA_ORIENTATION=+